MLSGGGAREGLLCLNKFSYSNERKGIRTELNQKYFTGKTPSRTRNASLTVDLYPVIFDSIVLKEKHCESDILRSSGEAHERV